MVTSILLVNLLLLPLSTKEGILPLQNDKIDLCWDHSKLSLYWLISHVQYFQLSTTADSLSKEIWMGYYYQVYNRVNEPNPWVTWVAGKVTTFLGWKSPFSFYSVANSWERSSDNHAVHSSWVFNTCSDRLSTKLQYVPSPLGVPLNAVHQDSTRTTRRSSKDGLRSRIHKRLVPQAGTEL